MNNIWRTFVLLTPLVALCHGLSACRSTAPDAQIKDVAVVSSDTWLYYRMDDAMIRGQCQEEILFTRATCPPYRAVNFANLMKALTDIVTADRADLEVQLSRMTQVILRYDTQLHEAATVDTNDADFQTALNEIEDLRLSIHAIEDSIAAQEREINLVKERLEQNFDPSLATQLIELRDEHYQLKQRHLTESASLQNKRREIVDTHSEYWQHGEFVEGLMIQWREKIAEFEAANTRAAEILKDEIALNFIMKAANDEGVYIEIDAGSQAFERHKRIMEKFKDVFDEHLRENGDQLAIGRSETLAQRFSNGEICTTGCSRSCSEHPNFEQPFDSGLYVGVCPIDFQVTNVGTLNTAGEFDVTLAVSSSSDLFAGSATWARNQNALDLDPSQITLKCTNRGECTEWQQADSVISDYCLDGSYGYELSFAGDGSFHWTITAKEYLKMPSTSATPPRCNPGRESWDYRRFIEWVPPFVERLEPSFTRVTEFDQAAYVRKMVCSTACR